MIARTNKTAARALVGTATAGSNDEGTPTMSTALTEIDRLRAIESLTARTEAFLDGVRALVPVVRENAAGAELARAVPDVVIDAGRAAGVFAALVPRSRGGLGLGIEALTETSRILAAADMSSAWVVSFMMEHSWLVNRMPLQCQEELFAERSDILCAAPMQPGGTGEKVDGGYLINVTCRYASGLPNSEWVLLGLMIDDEHGVPAHHLGLVPKSSLTVHDDWYFSGNAATGSGSATATNLFVPEHFVMRYDVHMSSDLHPGVVHEEAIYRFEVAIVLFIMVASLALGAAERMVELGRERMATGMIFGTRRMDLSLARARWLRAHQSVRTASSLHTSVLAKIREVGGRPWDDVESAQTMMDIITLTTLCKEAVRQIADGMGSSAYALSNPMQRYLRDVNVLANHAGFDEDFATETYAAAILGESGGRLYATASKGA